MADFLVPSINEVQVGEFSVFYREAGPPDAPTILLLHGFPSSSHQFRYLIPILATMFHVLAPDFPGFGFTKLPESYNHTFKTMADVTGGFLDALNVTDFSMYIFDYGAPVGLRLALDRPESIKSIISQNGNAYKEGLGEAWAPVEKYWASGSEEDRSAVQGLLAFDAVKSQYVNGTKDVSALAPEAWWLDSALLDRPGNADIQLDYIYDYRNNVALYPEFQQYLRQSQVPLLAVWGENDAFFIPPGAEAFRRDLPDAEVHLINAGHFALESSLEEIVGYMMPFLKRVYGQVKQC